MKVLIENKYYEIEIVRKKIKNTYLRVKSDLRIYVSTNKYVKDEDIVKLIKDNQESIIKMINRQNKKLEKKNKFFYLGKEYGVIICNLFKEPLIEQDKIYVKDIKDLNKFLVKEAKKVLPQRVKVCYDKMDNAIIPWPTIVIRKMTRKWGYCNKRDKKVTLNSELIKYNIDEIDYVVVHELCHFLHFDHSKAFWKSVEYYKPNYKLNRKVLREE